MTLNKSLTGSELTVAVAGRLDTMTAPELEALLKEESLDGVTALTFDFAALEYISSAGLRVLLLAQKAMNRQGRMKLRGVNENVMEVLEVTGFTEMLTIECPDAQRRGSPRVFPVFAAAPD